MKDDDNSKRNRLQKFFPEVKDCLEKMDDKLFSIINKDIPESSNVLSERTESLGKKEYHLLVAGK